MSALALVALTLALAAFFLYLPAHRRFLRGRLKSFTTWTICAWIFYTLHLVFHIVETLGVLGHQTAELLVYAALIIAGVFFLGSTFSLIRLSKEVGFAALDKSRRR